MVLIMTSFKSNPNEKERHQEGDAFYFGHNHRYERKKTPIIEGGWGFSNFQNESWTNVDPTEWLIITVVWNAKQPHYLSSYTKNASGAKNVISTTTVPQSAISSYWGGGGSQSGSATTGWAPRLSQGLPMSIFHHNYNIRENREQFVEIKFRKFNNNSYIMNWNMQYTSGSSATRTDGMARVLYKITDIKQVVLNWHGGSVGTNVDITDVYIHARYW